MKINIHEILSCGAFFGFSRCETDRLTLDFGGDLLLLGPRCLLVAVGSHRMKDSTLLIFCPNLDPGLG